MKIEQLLQMNQPYSFKDSQFAGLAGGEEINIIYLPEAEKTGINFINKLRKKGIFNEVLITPFVSFLNRKKNCSNYIAKFREKNPNIKVVPKFKTFVKGKINLIDLTPLAELYSLQLKNLSKFRATKELINIINQFASENKFYLLIDSANDEIENEFTDMLFKIARKNGFKIKQEDLKIEGALINKTSEDSFELFPLIQKKENELIFKFSSYTAFQKSFKTVDQDEIEALEKMDDTGKIDEEKEKQVTRKKILDTSDKILGNKTSNISNIEEIIKKGEHEQALDDLYELIHKDDIEGKTPLEKIDNLFKNQDPKVKEKIKKLLNYLETVNKKFNGVIDLNYKLIQESGDSYFDPEKIIKLKELTGYKKHASEFDETLDHSMFDLIKSIERDKDAGLQVLNINTEIIDNNKSRFKKYIITFKNIGTNNKRQYTKEILVPYPIKGKYFKLDGVNYIMINQFFPKPILKVKPNTVRLYTHFGTSMVWLTTHIINDTKDIDELSTILIKMNKAKISFIESDKMDKIIEDFNLDEVNPQLLSRKIEF